MSTITKINLSNVRKCHQYWEEMPENEKGRLCLQCHNTIIDFRKSTDAEIAEKHIFSEQKVCGLYRKDQLEFYSKGIEERKGTPWKAFYIGIFSFLSWSNYSQEKKAEVVVEQTDKKLDIIPKTILQKHSQDSIITKEKVIISGIITDENQVPLPGAYVVLKETKKGTSSNQDGFYKLDITDVLESQDSFQLSFGYIGYKEIVLSYDKLFIEDIKNRNIDVQFTEENVDLIVFSVGVKAPLHKRIWYKIRNVFRRK